jgi:hypothetical protein
MNAAKSEAMALIQALPDAATWDDIAYAVYVVESIEHGLTDATRGVFTTEEVRSRVLGRLRARV